MIPNLTPDELAEARRLTQPPEAKWYGAVGYDPMDDARNIAISRTLLTRLLDELEALRADRERLDIARDREYVAGLQAGWNLGSMDERDEFLQAVKARQREIRAAMKGSE